jgi:hypothetical protein
LEVYSLVEYLVLFFAGEWFGMPANEYLKGFLNTSLPRENATTITPTINGFAGPLFNCSQGEHALLFIDNGLSLFI